MRRSILISCRLILGLIFIYAAVGKIANPAEFADAVAAFKTLPISWVNIFAIILPWLEILCGSALLSGILLRSGAFTLAILNLVFIAAAASAMARGLDIECGCFTLSKAHDKVGWSLIGRDAVFLILCLPLLVKRRLKTSYLSSDEPLPGISEVEEEDRWCGSVRP